MSLKLSDFRLQTSELFIAPFDKKGIYSLCNDWYSKHYMVLGHKKDKKNVAPNEPQFHFTALGDPLYLG